VGKVRWWEEARALPRWLRVWSLKIIEFGAIQKLRYTVFYLPFIVTMDVSVTVYEIFSVKEWCDLENRVRVRSRSFEMAPFDRSHTISYSPSIVTMALCRLIYEI